ncbi:hypothetical protein FDH48_gp56 [Arthrobacter phage Jawnski]|uniref:Uncharacterized protein n=2 Tax=Jawnskivirus TaxID=3425003 RepID=A0A222Z2H1_9CAUD|nr:hypothetical protein FDH48_gp56 [Arthrobacter phage Jawnski]ALY09385.1 hypothetical protein JAWNSKI_56 [Arthrobacter phage Jawnski]ASR78157.1 hypothetical protein SEA_FRANZY_56 [Arthrobacter phage Franzy]
MPNTHMRDATLASAQLYNEETANENYQAEQGMTDEVMQFGALNRIAEAQLAVAYELRTRNNIEMLKIAKNEGWAESPDGQALRSMVIEALDLEDIAKLLAGQRRAQA